MWRLPLAAWATVGALSIFLLGPRQRVEGLHHYFHNYPHDSNFTVERAQYALERAVLKDFYFKTNPGLFGPQNKRDWISADKWLSKDVSHCLWEGITCTPNASVIRIFMPDNNLHGNVPRSLAKLPELRQLWLFGNNLGPSIPVHLADFTKLEVLFLQNNRYEGDVQPSLAKLKYLRILDLSGMHLGERLVRDNDTDTYVNGRNLTRGQMELTGIPEEYQDFENLEDLDLSYNLLHGTMPSVLGDKGTLKNKLKRFFLSSNRFNGTVPESWANMTQLQKLTFDLNIGMCSDTIAPHPPSVIGVLPGTLLPRVCPLSKGPENALHDDMPLPGDQVARDSPYNHRHPLDRGIDTVTYCGPSADPQPVPCRYETLVPPRLRERAAQGLTNISWLYPAQGTLAIRNGVPTLTEMTRYERREHREAGYPFEYLPILINGKPAEEASTAGLDGIVNMWNDNQKQHGYRTT